MAPKFLLLLFFIAVTISKTTSTSRLLLQETYITDVPENDTDFSEGLSDLESSETALLDQEEIFLGRRSHAPTKAPADDDYPTARKLVQETVVDDISGLADDDDASAAAVAPALEAALESWEDDEYPTARKLVQETVDDDITGKSGIAADIDVSVVAAVAPALEAALESWEDDDYPTVRNLVHETVVDDISGLAAGDVSEAAVAPALEAALESWADDDYTTARQLVQEMVVDDISGLETVVDLSAMAAAPALDSMDDEATVEEVPEHIYDVLAAAPTIYA